MEFNELFEGDKFVFTNPETKMDLVFTKSGYSKYTWAAGNPPREVSQQVDISAGVRHPTERELEIGKRIEIGQRP